MRKYSWLPIAAAVWSAAMCIDCPAFAGGKISGRIVSEDAGEAISGAEVIASAGRKRFRGRAGADGNYVFNNLPPGKYRVRLSDQYRDRANPPDYSQLVVAEGKTTSGIDFKIVAMKRYRIEGIVKDGEGKQIEGVEIKIKSRYKTGGDEFGFASSSDVMAVSDEQGRFKFEIDGRKGQEVSVLAGKEGYSPYKGDPLILEDDGKAYQFEVVLGSGGVIAGCVKDWEGKAVHGARVRIFDQGQRAEVVTDGDGKFVMRNVTAGTHSLTVECDGYARFQRDVTVGADGGEPISVELGPTAFLKGKVVDHAGNPLGDVQLNLAYKELHYARIRKTESDGRYTFDAVPTGDHILTAKKDGYCTQVMRDVKLDTGDCVIAMTKAETIKGHVLDAATGKPVERFSVAPMESQDGSGRYRHIDSAKFSNREGAFEVRNIDPKRKYKIFIEAEGYAIAWIPDVTYAGPDQALTVKLERGAEIAGQVIDAESKKAVPYSNVLIVSPGQKVVAAFEWGRDEDFDCSNVITGDMTGANGKFRCKNVPKGRWNVLAAQKGYEQKGDKIVELNPAKGNIDVVIELSANRQGQTSTIDR